MKYICELCGKEFKTFPSWLKRSPITGTRFCSRRCAHLALGIGPRKINCKSCGQDFIPKNKHSQFCSMACYFDYCRSFREERECPVCGRKFQINKWNKNKKYCSRDCFHKGSRGPRAWAWTEVKCAVCGKTFRIYRSKLVRDGKERTFCSRRCATKGWWMGIKPREVV